MNRLSSYISLFASTGTLFCCALPSLLVALGMGATMAGLVSALPQIIWLSEYKGILFSISGAMILFASYMQYRAKFEPCPIDVAKAQACRISRKWSLCTTALSGVFWALGAFFAFIAPKLF